MGFTACTEPQCLYKGSLYLTYLLTKLITYVITYLLTYLSTYAMVQSPS